MDNELISKKELLELSNISYGQLYRWKRKNLIPEEWFIKKASFTGQETFFPRQSILERVEKIKNMKDEASLDELAQIFSPELSNVKINEELLLENNIVMQGVLNIYKELKGEDTSKNQQDSILVYSFNEILYMSILQAFLVEGSISLPEGKVILETLVDNYSNYESKDMEVIFIRKMGVGFCLLTLSQKEIVVESLANIMMRIKVLDCVEQLKIKLKELY